MKDIGFQKHPSVLLNNLYKIKNYQGANPADAKVLFVGRDPNWAIDLESKEMFNFVADYLTDGISFWEKHTIHHPFLLPNYKGDGKRYHRIFSKLKVESNQASKISFVELIGFPTTGMAKSNNKIFLEYLISEENRIHLIELDKFFSHSDKTIFIAWGLMNDFKIIYDKTGLFKKFAELDKSKMIISDLNNFENIFIHRHFSDAISNSTLDKMGMELEKILKDETSIDKNKLLFKVSTDESGWITYYVDENSCKWIEDYPDSENHGGGLPRIRKLEKFPWE
ncbi:Imm27 family immunity protein [Flavobacterium antarcticum]|uniref:Imm27 family immunity protein n=1 Tax=Flavobacterium antarcticum TaxID=271155 RepID=UPI0003B49BC9|nr:Imm27 family immunity protein [Flavobacterium antarcticum]